MVVDQELFDRVRELYLGLGEWSRNKSYYNFADPVSLKAVQSAKRLARIRTEMHACAGTDGKMEVKKGDGRVSVKIKYDSISAVWIACMTESEFNLLLNGKEETSGCGVC